jgi:hypothetical protein
VQAHEALSRLARERATADAEEGRCLLLALRSGAHLHLGFGSFNEYVERLFGYRARSTQEKLRVAEALETLPRIALALETGGFSWSAVRELTRVAVPETESDWLAAASGKTVHQLEVLVAGKAPGDGPDSPANQGGRRVVLRFDVAPETLALWREAMSRLRELSGGPLDDDAVLLLLARQTLGGPSDTGRASYQIALDVCSDCGRDAQRAAGELVPVGVEVVEMAKCDGQHIGAHVGAASNASDVSRAKQTVPPRIRRAVLRRDQRRCLVPGCRNARFLDIHHIELRSEGGGNDPENLITLCGAHHRAAHRGELLITGNAPVRVRFEHADGSAYGRVSQPGLVGIHGKAFAALRGLGFREGEVRKVLVEIRTLESSVPLEGRTVEDVVREALGRLTRGQATNFAERQRRPSTSS